MSTKADELVDAVRAVRALEAAINEDGATEARAQALKDAKYLVRSLESKMSSRELWIAREQLKRRD